MRVQAKSKGGHKKLYLVLDIIVGVIILRYFSVSFYFMSHFYPNTKINGKDFSWKTVSVVEECLQSKVEGCCLKIQEKDQEKDVILGKDISLESQKR